LKIVQLLWYMIGGWTIVAGLSKRFIMSSSAFNLGHNGRLFHAAAAATATAGLSASTSAEAVTTAGASVGSTTTTTNTDNPLLKMPYQYDLPPFRLIEASHVTPAVDHLLEQLQTEFAQLETKLTSCQENEQDDDAASVSYETVVDAVERLQYPLSSVWGVVGHLNGVANSDEIRAAHQASQPAVVQAISELGQSQALYQALKALQQRDESFTRAQERAVQLAVQRMTLGGVGLSGRVQERFNEIQQRLASLATSFSNHVLDATKAFYITIADAAEIQGAPATARAMWAAAHVAAAANKDEDKEAAADDPIASADSDAGPWRLTLDGPSYMAVMQHVANRDLREQVYRAYITRASDVGSNDQEQNNIALVYEILTLRQEMAKLLGFANYAELSLASKMAPSMASVTELSELVRASALPAAQREWDEISAFAQATDPNQTLPLQPWDTSFWSERLKESKFSLTEEETRPYFALPAVLHGMFALVERLFGIQVEAADGEAQVWHDDVRFFKVYSVPQDATQEKQHMASFYLDPYARPANKRGGAWMDVCVGKSAAIPRDIAVAYLTCNGSPPNGDTPSLMTFREVETLFHEFGHGLQHMLTTVSVGDVAGINGVEWDAVELPSQFMENWYEESVFSLLRFCARVWHGGIPPCTV
jgi:oligopeptidase A